MHQKETEKAETTPLPPIKKAHVEIYNFIQGFIHKNIYAPEYNEIATGLDMSPSYIPKLVKELCDMGYISRDYRKQRSIKILKDLRSEVVVDNT